MRQRLSTPAGRSLLELRYGMRETIANYAALCHQDGDSARAPDAALEALGEIRERIMQEPMDTRSPRRRRRTVAKKTHGHTGKKKPETPSYLKKLIRIPYACVASSKNSWLKSMRRMFLK